MALKKCSSCGQEISDRAKMCPNCRYKLRKNISGLHIIIFFTLLIVIGIFVGLKNQELKEQKRQEQIEALLKKSNEYYKNLDFDSVLECYEQLDGLNYDTAKLRAIAEYDQNVAEDAKLFYDMLLDVDSKLHSGDYIMLSELMNTLDEPIKRFDNLEINMDSQFGKYINTIRNNVMYSMLKTDYVNSNKLDLDYGLTSWGFAYCIELCTEQLVAEKFPYTTEE